VLVVVHVPPDRANVLVPLLQAKCRMAVKEAEDKEPVVAGVIYFAPSDYHLLVETDESLALSTDEAVNYSRPSIDVLFESAADAYGRARRRHPDRRQSRRRRRTEGDRRRRRPGDRGRPRRSLCLGHAPAGAGGLPSAMTMNLDAIASYLSSLGAA
jgi:two-component system chemotaxis response regulator CheB